MYWSEIFQYLSLPILIFITYRLILYYLKRFNKKLVEDGEE